MTRADPTANLPPVRVEPDARRRIRRALAEAGRRIAVLDDDPTGSQTVHDVDVVTVFEPDELAAGLSSAGSTCFTDQYCSLPRPGGGAETDRTHAVDLAICCNVPIDVGLQPAATRRYAVVMSSPRNARRTLCCEANGRGSSVLCTRRRSPRLAASCCDAVRARQRA